MATKQNSFDLDDEKPVKIEELDPLYKFEGHFKDTLQKLHPDENILLRRTASGKKSKAARRRNNPRYKTQPITFDEIKEVDEEGGVSTPPITITNTETDTKEGLITQLSEWSKSVDGLMLKRPLKKEDNKNTQSKSQSQQECTQSSAPSSQDGVEEKNSTNKDTQNIRTRKRYNNKKQSKET